MNRPPTARELKKYEGFNGLPPHRRPQTDPPHCYYPTLSLPELISARALLCHLLAREYGFSIGDIAKIIACEDVAFVEKLVSLGDEIAPGSAVVTRMKEVVLRIAKMIVTMNDAIEEKERRAAIAKGKKIRPKKQKASGAPRSDISPAEVAQLRGFMIGLLGTEFKMSERNIRPLFNYPGREATRRLIVKAERSLHRWSPTNSAGKRALAAAKAIVEKAGHLC